MIPRPIARHLDGFRGAFILMLTTPWLLVGLSYLMVRTQSRSEAFFYFPNGLDENELGWVWIVAALLMLACAALGKHHPQATTVGFLIAMVPPLVWVLVFSGGILLGGPITLAVSVVMYAAFAAIIFFVSGWPNPRPGDLTRGS